MSGPVPSVGVRVPSAAGRRVALLTLGCARNEVDSEELAARLDADGWELTPDGDGADVCVVNTCGFVEKAKQDSIDTLLAAAGTGAKVVRHRLHGRAVRRGSWPSRCPRPTRCWASTTTPDIAARLTAVLAGEQPRGPRAAGPARRCCR